MGPSRGEIEIFFIILYTVLASVSFVLGYLIKNFESQSRIIVISMEFFFPGYGRQYEHISYWWIFTGLWVASFLPALICYYISHFHRVVSNNAALSEKLFHKSLFLFFCPLAVQIISSFLFIFF